MAELNSTHFKTKQNIYCHGTPPWHLMHVHLFPPTQQPETDHEIAAIYGNLRQSAISCHVLPYSAYLFLPQYLRYPQRPWLLPNSAKFCQDHDPKPILPHACVNQAIKLMIYTPSSRFLISFPYATSWFHYTVHVCSLIISTLLYIIVTRTHSVINN